ncbi:hypothetical protein scyTo_0027296, partial [Scyliorhinus torazame]|nr:hypothetical protein [Scyliorhinus torazame]
MKLAREGFSIDHILAGAVREAAAHRVGLCPLLCDQAQGPEGEGANTTNRKLADVREKASLDMEGASFPESLAWKLAGDLPEKGRQAFMEAVTRLRATLVEPLVTELDHFSLYIAPPPASGDVLTQIIKRAKQPGLSLASVSSVENASTAYRDILNAAQQVYRSLSSFLGQKQSRDRHSMKVALAGSQLTIVDDSGNVFVTVG